MPATPPRVIAYYRVSTKKQGDSGLGLEGQAAAAVGAYVATTGAKLLGPPYHEIESGRHNDRPELAKAISHARRAHAALLIAKHLNELGEGTRRGGQWTAMQVSRVLDAARRKTMAFDRVMTPTASPEAREADLREWVRSE